MTRVALGIDVRVRAFLGEVGSVLQLLEAGGSETSTSSSSTRATRRFCAASARRAAHIRSRPRRRRLREGALAVLDGVRSRARATRPAPRQRDAHRRHHQHERPRPPADPRRALRPRLRRRAADGRRASLSFGFKYGTPVDADLVLDVRFLENPYFVPELRRLTGLDDAVSALRNGGARDTGVHAPYASASRVRDAEVRTRGKELPDDRRRLHGRTASLRGDRRRACAGAVRALALQIAVVHRDVDRGGSRLGTCAAASGRKPRRRARRTVQRSRAEGRDDAAASLLPGSERRGGRP